MNVTRLSFLLANRTGNPGLMLDLVTNAVRKGELETPDDVEFRH